MSHSRPVDMNSALDSNGRHAELAIQPYAQNPLYWQYGGKPVLLFGGSDRDNLFHWAGDGSRLTDHLDLLRDCGGNYVRCTMNSRSYTEEGYRWDLLSYPFKCLAGGKYDLDRWNEEHWSKLQTFLTETQARGIFAQIEVWDMWNESGDSEDAEQGIGWYCSPWNPNNNVNYDWQDSPLLTTGKTAFYNPFFQAVTTNDPVLLPYQRKYVGRIVDECLAFDHVLFQIDNESGIELAVGEYWARFISERAATAGKRVYVCDSRNFRSPSKYVTKEFQTWDNPEIRHIVSHPEVYTFCDISQNNGNTGQEQYDNLVWYVSKVKQHGIRPVNHTKCYHFNWPTGGDYTYRTSPSDAEAGAKFWRAVFGGAASIRFHRHTPCVPGGIREGFGLRQEGQTHIRSMRMFVESVNLFAMSPNNSVLGARTGNEAYALVNPGEEYAVYFTGDGNGQVSIDLSDAVSDYAEAWLDVLGNKWTAERTIRGGQVHALNCPGSGQWVVVIKRAT